MEWRFNGRHGLFLDLAGILSSFFFFIHFHIQPSFQNFLVFLFQLTPTSGGAHLQCLKAAGRDQRWTAGMYRMEWNLKKGTLFYT